MNRNLGESRNNDNRGNRSDAYRGDNRPGDMRKDTRGDYRGDNSYRSDMRTDGRGGDNRNSER